MPFLYCLIFTLQIYKKYRYVILFQPFILCRTHVKLGDFKDYTKENRFYVSSTGLFDKVNLPIQFGTRYVIHDKYHLCQISSLTDYDRKDRNTHFFHLRKKNIILIKINDGRKKTLKFKYKGNCESCLGELRKLYSDF